jgi:hypothetical protein
VVQIAMEFDAGVAADPADALGTQALMLNLLEEGTTSRNSIQIAEEQERLGAQIAPNAGLDRTALTLAALDSEPWAARSTCSPTSSPIGPSRAKWSGCAPSSSRTRGADPAGGPRREHAAAPLYGRTTLRPPSTAAAIAGCDLSRDDLGPLPPDLDSADNATIFACGDLPLAELVPQLEARFGNWTRPAAQGHEDFPARRRHRVADHPRRPPQSPQSLIVRRTPSCRCAAPRTC